MYDHERSLVTELAGKPFALIGVNTDDDLETIRKVVKEKNLNWRSFYDGGDGSISRQYKIQAFPTVMLLDHKGVIREINPGDLDSSIDKLLAEVR
jgi:hypothetical protein